MGKLTLVGIGPGDGSYLTGAARQALSEAELLCGYTLYVDLVRHMYPDKEIFATGMTGEIERCRYALEAAARKNVALLCSGDPGIYGMAGLVFELAKDFPGTDITIVPGVTAALSGAALLGAPLGHDFCVISLSDRLTPWAVIEKRLRAAAAGDFAICLYNPASRHRKDYLSRACAILLESLSPDTICGIAKNIAREGESIRILSLEQLKDAPADMFSTVFIGSTKTEEIGGRMVTPRGYPI